MSAAQAFHKEAANHFIYFNILAIHLLVAGEPAALPISNDTETMRIRMYGVSHIIERELGDVEVVAEVEASVIFMRLFLRRMAEARPNARGI